MIPFVRVLNSLQQFQLKKNEWEYLIENLLIASHMKQSTYLYHRLICAIVLFMD